MIVSELAGRRSLREKFLITLGCMLGGLAVAGCTSSPDVSALPVQRYYNCGARIDITLRNPNDAADFEINTQQVPRLKGLDIEISPKAVGIFNPKNLNQTKFDSLALEQDSTGWLFVDESGEVLQLNVQVLSDVSEDVAIVCPSPTIPNQL